MTMNEIKFNGKPFRKMPGGQQIYKVKLKGGPLDKHPTLCTFAVPCVFMNGERYELNADGDYVYAPDGLN
jgi:hypothetical protein